MGGDLDITQLILYALVGVAVIGGAMFVLPMLKNNKRAQRIDMVVTKRRADLGRQQMDKYAAVNQLRQKKEKAYVRFAQSISRTLKLDELLSGKQVTDFLARAGIRGKQALAVYALSRVLAAIGGAVGCFIVLSMMEEGNTDFYMTLAMCAGAGVAGFYLPKLIITNQATKRAQEMTRAFPDAMDLMVICVEAGLSIEGAFDRVTHEIAENSTTLSAEMGLLTAELAFLGDRGKAYQNFADRTGVPAIKSLATSLIQSERYGTSVSTAVKVLSEEKRQERMAAAEKKAAALPAKLTVPMIVFFLPVLFIVVLGPTILQLMAD